MHNVNNISFTAANFVALTERVSIQGCIWIELNVTEL